MTSTIDTLTVDCADPGVLGRFWAEVLRWRVVDEGDGEIEIFDPAGRDRPILFQVVPEPKTVKNRWHLDLRPTTSMGAEVERVVGLGAEVLERIDEHGSSWTVLQDPGGNEFCVLRGPQDGWSPEGPGDA